MKNNTWRKKILKKLTTLFLISWALLMLAGSLFVFNSLYPGWTDVLFDTAVSQSQEENLSLNEIPVDSKTSKETAYEETVKDELPSSSSSEIKESHPSTFEDNIQNTLPGIEQYEEPDRSQIEVPHEVAGKNGYEPIQEQREEIPKEDGEKIKERLGPGETGDGLTFDPMFYPYYEILNEKGKHLYRQIFANAKALNTNFSPVEQASSGEVKTAFEAVCNDHPELFYMDTAYTAKCLKNGECVEIQLQMNRTASNLDKAMEQFSQKSEEILANARNAGTDYEKERYVHDRLIELVDYSLTAPMNQSAYSALVNGKTVCAGYARAFQYLMQQLGVPCYYTTGYAGENHAWNIVSLEDGYYNVDSTWDDTSPATYDYFNKSDKDYAGTHVRDGLSVYLPACNGQMYRSQESDGKRNITDLGLNPEDALTTLEDYFANCYAQAMDGEKGTKEFANVIKGKELFQEWYHTYDNESYKEGYASQLLMDSGASSCQLTLEVEELADDMYYIQHTLVLQ